MKGINETSDSALRILFVCPSPRAGTPQYTHNLASHLARRGHCVSVLTTTGYELAPYARDYTVIEALGPQRPRPLRLLREFAAHRPQIIHYQGGQHPDLLLLLDVVLRGSTPGVYTPHDLRSNTPRAYHDRAMKWLLRRMNHIIFSSPDNREFALRDWQLSLPSHATFRVPDLMEFVRSDVQAEAPAVPPGRRLLLCFGLIEQRKGIGTLLEAFARLRSHVTNVHLAIVGKALMDLAPLRVAIARYALEDAITLVADYVSFEQMAGWFERAEALVLPYESGWNSGVIAVAQGFRKPLIATSVVAADGSVEHEQTGLVVPPSNPPALAAAMQRLLLDSELQTAMQAPIERAAAAGGWHALVEHCEAMYRQLVTEV